MSDTPILFDKPFPEVQVKSPYTQYTNRIMGSVYVTGGFMEPHGHGRKNYTKRAIFADGTIKTIGPGNHNIGFDYTKGYGTDTICMYSGVVTKAGKEGGYGYRIHVKLDIPLIWQGKSYVCYQAYAHNSKLLKRVGDRVSQGEAIAIEAGHGSRGPRDYGSHVDLDTYIYLGQEKVHVNFELLAQGVDKSSYIEKIELMKIGTSGVDVRWLNAKLGRRTDETYNEGTKVKVQTFQRDQNLVGDGIAGENTCIALDMTGYAIYIGNTTFLKLHPVQSSTLERHEKDQWTSGALVEANWIEDKGDHWYFECKQKIKGKYNWYAFKEHVLVCEGYAEDLDTVNLAGDFDIDAGDLDQDDLVWIKALKDCQTKGCSSQTSKISGVKGSHKLAKDHTKFLNRKLIDICVKIGDKYNIPPSLIIAIASRESHIGNVLGAPSGSKEGWGDRNHAFGIMQVDRRFHNPKGKPDPFSLDHIDQAVGILAQYRDQVKLRKPRWNNSNVLKGACVAYNSGANNVQSITGMNKGTTGNDYGDDVIARAQFFQAYIY